MSHAILAAHVVTQAGGIASTGMFNGSVQRILDCPPTGGIHDRCPIIMGSARDVNKVLARYEEDDDDAGGSAAKKPRTG
jgi:fructose-1,6-bisphosphatase I